MMRKLLILLILLVVVLFASCSRDGLKRYYKRISLDEFKSYDSVVVVSKSKYGKVYHVYTNFYAGNAKVPQNLKIDFLVFEKKVKGETVGLFKLDESTEIKNDSTFAFYGLSLVVTTDTVNWVKGIWFYTTNKNGSTDFKVDSLPRNLPKIDYQKLMPGIYRYQSGKLNKISSQQSEDAFNELKPQGFIYLPNPGRFYILANFKQIE